MLVTQIRSAHPYRAGEAQQIDRIMEKFAERFCRDNPGAFSNADGAYLLSFAIIMLNTDAHNPMADAHMSKDDFVMMCQTQVIHCALSCIPKFSLHHCYASPVGPSPVQVCRCP